jgi:DNA-binding winged helix-turn-helix (wHTH) protein
LLVALSRYRVDRPGQALSADELVRVGWPGERITRSAALNRLNFSIVTLRKMGLKDTLQNIPRVGYRLDPDVPVVIIHKDSAGPPLLAAS